MRAGRPEDRYLHLVLPDAPTLHVFAPESASRLNAQLSHLGCLRSGSTALVRDRAGRRMISAPAVTPGVYIRLQGCIITNHPDATLRCLNFHLPRSHKLCKQNAGLAVAASPFTCSSGPLAPLVRWRSLLLATPRSGPVVTSPTTDVGEFAAR